MRDAILLDNTYEKNTRRIRRRSSLSLFYHAVNGSPVHINTQTPLATTLIVIAAAPGTA